MSLEGGRYSGEPKISGDPTGMTICYSTNTFVATTEPGSAQVIRRAGSGSSLALIEIFGKLHAQTLLQGGREAVFRREIATVPDAQGYPARSFTSGLRRMGGKAARRAAHSRQ